MEKICIPGFRRTCPFIGFAMTGHLPIESLLYALGIVPLDGTWRCLSVLACVDCPGVFMTLCAYPHVGHYQVGHFAVQHLMSTTTHLMCIKCGDSVYLLTRAARLHNVCPPWSELDPCISSLINDVLGALQSIRKFSAHNYKIVVAFRLHDTCIVLKICLFFFPSGNNW